MKPYSQLFDYMSPRRAPEGPGEPQRAPESPRPEGFSLETLQFSSVQLFDYRSPRRAPEGPESPREPQTRRVLT